MSNATYDAAFVRDFVQDDIVENYIVCAILAVLVYDTSKPSLIYPNLSPTAVNQFCALIKRYTYKSFNCGALRTYSNHQGRLLLGIVLLQVSSS